MKKIIILITGVAIGALLFQWLMQSKSEMLSEDSEEA